MKRAPGSAATCPHGGHQHQRVAAGHHRVDDLSLVATQREVAEHGVFCFAEYRDTTVAVEVRMPGQIP